MYCCCSGWRGVVALAARLVAVLTIHRELDVVWTAINKQCAFIWSGVLWHFTRMNRLRCTKYNSARTISDQWPSEPSHCCILVHCIDVPIASAHQLLYTHRRHSALDNAHDSRRCRYTARRGKRRIYPLTFSLRDTNMNSPGACLAYCTVDANQWPLLLHVAWQTTARCDLRKGSSPGHSVQPTIVIWLWLDDLVGHFHSYWQYPAAVIRKKLNS